MFRKAALILLPLVVLLTLLGGGHLAARTPTLSDPLLVRLQLVTFDPLTGEPDIPDGQRLTIQADRPTTYLVQFTGPVRDEWKANAEKAGVRLYGYIPDYAFIACMDPSTAESVRATPFVRWVGPYHPAYRLASTFRYAIQSAQPVAISVQTLPDADLDALAERVEAWGGEVLRRAANDFAGYLRASLSAGRLPDLAALDGVLWVEPYLEPELANDVGGGQIMRVNDVRSSLGLYGSGQIVAVADTGLDLGSAADIHADFAGRVINIYALGRPCDGSDPNAHGTHVAGSVLGSGVNSGSNPDAHSYANSFAGAAPEASLIFQSLQDIQGGLGGIPNDLNDLFEPTYDDGARVHTNSWGGRTGGTYGNPEYGGYTIFSQMADQFLWNHKDMAILFATGNDGTDKVEPFGVVDPDSIMVPGTAKNVITVGASESEQATASTQTWGDWWPDDYGYDPITSDHFSDNAQGMTAFSGRGPTDDGRVKPDVVGPGANIVSVRSRHAQADTGWGVYDDHYLYMGGTSMATPLVAGAAALAREWLISIQGIANPSGALMKAILLNGAADMSPGQYGAGSAQEIPALRPNNVTGWGRVDLVESLNPLAPRNIWSKDDSTGLSTGRTAAYKLTVGSSPTTTLTTPPSAGGPFRIILAWADYPGEPAAAKALVNDLDLEVIAPDDAHYYGNQGLYSGGQCLADEKWDACNNVEGVIIPSASDGVYTIIVHGANVPQGGSQPFALAASGDNLREEQGEQRLVYLPLALKNQ